MTKKEKKTRLSPKEMRFEHMRVSLAMAGIACDPMTAELLVEVFDAQGRSGGNFNIRDASNIEWAVRRRHNKKQITFQKTQNSILKEMKEIVDELKAIKNGHYESPKNDR